jgi:hypothetical protein
MSEPGPHTFPQYLPLELREDGQQLAPQLTLGGTHTTSFDETMSKPMSFPFGPGCSPQEPHCCSRA